MVVAIGEALIDFISMIDESGKTVFVPVPGGSPYNTAVALSRLGTETTYITRVSTDFLGDILVGYLKDNGVRTHDIARTSEQTTLAFVQNNPSGDPRYAFYANNTADSNLADVDLPQKLSDKTRFLICGSISLSMEPVGSSIERFVLRHSKNRFLSFDPNIRPSTVFDITRYRDRLLRIASQSAVVKLSDEDIDWIYPDESSAGAAEKILVSGAGTVIITRGSDGCEFFQKHRRIKIEAVSAPNGGDSIGAGDTFHAALISWFYTRNIKSSAEVHALSDQQIADLLQFASLAASITCSRTGADPPYRNEMA